MNLLLLDANVIISLHELGLWEQVTKNNKVYVPTTIIYQEVYWYPDANGNKVSIDLTRQIGKSIEEISATAEEIAILKNKLSPADRENIDLGESEALAILEKNADMVFCSSDQYAIIAAVLLNMEGKVISLERLLGKPNLLWKSSERAFQKWIKDGTIRKIQNTDLLS